MSTEKSASFPLRMPVELLDKIKHAVTETGISQQDVMRLCIRIGLKDLERIDWDIAGLVSNEVAKISAPITALPNPPLLRAAEDTDSTTGEPQKPVDYKRVVHKIKLDSKQAAKVEQVLKAQHRQSED